MNRLSLVPLLPTESFSWEANLFLGLGHGSAVPLEEQRRRRRRRRRWWRAWRPLSVALLWCSYYRNRGRRLLDLYLALFY